MKTRNIKTIMASVLACLALSVTAMAKPIDPTKSTVEWLGKKVTGKHNGTVDFKTGNVILEQDKVVGGTFVVDMTTIDTKDLSGIYKGKLDKHLKSSDFFDVAKYPTATFKITSVADTVVKGDLTIKGHTEKKSFALAVKNNTIAGKVTINRSKYGITYKSPTFFENLKDKAIYDEFELTVKIVW